MCLPQYKRVKSGRGCLSTTESVKKASEPEKTGREQAASRKQLLAGGDLFPAVNRRRQHRLIQPRRLPARRFRALRPPRHRWRSATRRADFAALR